MLETSHDFSLLANREGVVATMRGALIEGASVADRLAEVVERLGAVGIENASELLERRVLETGRRLLSSD